MKSASASITAQAESPCGITQMGWRTTPHRPLHFRQSPLGIPYPAGERPTPTCACCGAPTLRLATPALVRLLSVVKLTAQIGNQLLHRQLYALPVWRRSGVAAATGKARCSGVITAFHHCWPQGEKLGCCIQAQPSPAAVGCSVAGEILTGSSINGCSQACQLQTQPQRSMPGGCQQAQPQQSMPARCQTQSWTPEQLALQVS